MNIPSGKHIYFASDFHLGVPNQKASLEREKKIVSWLKEIQPTAHEIYLVGDIFDFWFEYKHAVPKGFTRLLGTIADLTDSGIPVHVFTGNHDMWIFDYLPKEIGVQLHREPIIKEWNGVRFYIGHGDGLGPGDHGYKFVKKFFESKLCQWLFARIHPNTGISLANFWSRQSRKKGADSDAKFLGEDKEWLVVYAKELLKNEHFDYFIFGHRHMPLTIELNDRSTYINLGDWINHFTYGDFDGNHMELATYNK